MERGGCDIKRNASIILIAMSVFLVAGCSLMHSMQEDIERDQIDGQIIDSMIQAWLIDHFALSDEYELDFYYSIGYTEGSLNDYTIFQKSVGYRISANRVSNEIMIKLIINGIHSTRNKWNSERREVEVSEGWLDLGETSYIALTFDENGTNIYIALGGNESYQTTDMNLTNKIHNLFFPSTSEESNHKVFRHGQHFRDGELTGYGLQREGGHISSVLSIYEYFAKTEIPDDKRFIWTSFSYDLQSSNVTNIGIIAGNGDDIVLALDRLLFPDKTYHPSSDAFDISTRMNLENFVHP